MGMLGLSDQHAGLLKVKNTLMTKKSLSSWRVLRGVIINTC